MNSRKMKLPRGRQQEKQAQHGQEEHGKKMVGKPPVTHALLAKSKNTSAAKVASPGTVSAHQPVCPEGDR